MPFEPRLILRDDEPEDELALPADLQELSEQLSADASYLAQRFPAPGSTTAPPRAQAKSLRWAMTMVAVAAGLSAVAQFTWHDPLAPPAAIEPVPVAAADPLPALVQPAAFFHELTGPEQEALLDLWDEQQVRQASFTI